MRYYIFEKKCLASVFVDLSDKFEEMIVRRYLIKNRFPTFLASVRNHITLVFPMIDTNWFHLSVAFRRAIAREILIDMLRREAERTMIPGGTVWMKADHLSAIFADERFVSHDKGHEKWRLNEILS